MVKTQIQLPEELYAEAKRVAREREMSLADVIRQGAEYITAVYPPLARRRRKWSPPAPSPMGAYLTPPEEWRLLVNEPPIDRLTGPE
jgi:hypothetical protein